MSPNELCRFRIAGALILASSLSTGCNEKPKWRGYDPGSPASAAVSAAPAAEPESEPLERDPIRPLHRRTYSIVVDGDLVHTGTTAGVVSWDFSDRKDPKRLASLVLEGSVQRLTALPPPLTLIAVATGPTGLAIVDVRKAQEEELALINEHPWDSKTRGGCHSAWQFVAGKQGEGFLACGASGVARVNLEDPALPSVVSRVPVDGYVRDVVVLEEPSGVARSAASTKKLAAAAGTEGLAIVDFGGIKPRALAKVELGGEARALAVRDGHAYVAAGAAGLVVVDVRNPTEPTVVGRLLPKTTDMARGISMSDEHALLCLGDSGLALVDVVDPANPKEVGRFDPKGSLNRVTVSGKQLFVANDAEGVTILDISDPRQPVPVYPSDSKDGGS